MWLVKFVSGSGIQGYHVLLIGAIKILEDDADEAQEKKTALKLIKFTAYNELILAQKYTVCFQIIEEAKTKANNYGDARLAWTKLSRNFEPTTGSWKENTTQ